MSLRPHLLPPVPEEIAHLAQAVFPRGDTHLRLRDELGPLFEDRGFATLFPRRGQPGLSPGFLGCSTSAPRRGTGGPETATGPSRRP